MKTNSENYKTNTETKPKTGKQNIVWNKWEKKAKQSKQNNSEYCVTNNIITNNSEYFVTKQHNKK